MQLEELQKLVKKGESETIELKKSTGLRTEAAKTVCAMLNGLGGLLFFGVTDKGELIGQQVSTKTLEEISHEFRRIEPPAFPEIQTISLNNDKSIILIRIPGYRGSYRYDGRPYIRYGPITQVMPQEEYEVRILEKFHAHRRWENEFAPDWVTIQDLDEEEIQTTLASAIYLGRMKKPTHTDTKSILLGLELIKDGRLLNAAVALYGKSQRLFSSYTQLMVRVARFRGSTRIKGFKDNREYWGHAFNLLRHGEQFLMDHVPIPGRVVPGKMVREDYPLYPSLATREAIANAICHRDYTQPSAVAIAMYDDHLEVINPGILNFGITPEKLVQPHESKPWNPIIANVLYRAGIIEEWGMGTMNILDWCKANGNPEPKWEIRTQSVVMTFLPTKFYATGILDADRPKSQVVKLETLEATILVLLKNGPLSKREIALNLGQKQVSGGLKKILATLLEKNVISSTIPDKPKSRLQKYKLTL